jgi:Calcineurin-like phosphoesterase superfamily domain
LTGNRCRRHSDLRSLSEPVLLRQTICRHLCRSRSQEILDVLQRIRLRFLGTCGLASASSSLSLATKDYSGRLLAGRHPMNQRRAIRIGVIADTHGLFDPAIRRHFRDVDYILHTGDIGKRSVIEQLEQIALVTASSPPQCVEAVALGLNFFD